MAAITFANLAPDDLERVANFASLPLHASLSYRSQIESRWVDEIKELLSNENAVGFVAQAGATVCGLAICAPLAWESPLLGKSMWTIKHICVAIRRSDRICIATGLVEETLRRIGARDADFLLCKAMPSDTDIIHALESNGFLLMDTLLNFVFDCRAGRSNDRPAHVLLRRRHDLLEMRRNRARRRYPELVARLHDMRQGAPQRPQPKRLPDDERVDDQ